MGTQQANVAEVMNSLSKLHGSLSTLKTQLTLPPEPREGKPVERSEFFKMITGFDEKFIKNFFKKFDLTSQEAVAQGKTKIAKEWVTVFYSLNNNLPLPDAQDWRDKIKTIQDWNDFRYACIRKFLEPGKDFQDPEKDIPHKIKKLKAVNGELLETGQPFQAGRFYELSLEELDKKVKEKESKEGKVATPGTFNIIQRGQDPEYKLTLLVDTGALQAKPENAHSVSQVASQFNGYEATGVYSPEDGITGFVSDKTQGPVASISAAPGTVQRIHYVFYDKKTKPDTWRQTETHQIELLDKTPLKCVHGYVDLNQKNPDQATIDAAYKQIKIGLQKDTQVTFGLMLGDKHIPINDPKQIIHQVFTAAVNCGNTSGSTNLKIYKGSNGTEEQKKAIHIAKRILDAAYEGTIKAAYAFGKKKVFLTLIGGGAFQNQLSWILDAINKNIPFIKEKGLEVHLIIFSATSGLNPKFYDQLKEEMPTLLKMVNGTNGVYKFYYFDDEKPVEKILKTQADLDAVQNVLA